MNELQKGDRVQYAAGGYISRIFGRVVDTTLVAHYNEESRYPPREGIQYVVKWENEGTVDTTTYPSNYLRKVS